MNDTLQIAAKAAQRSQPNCTHRFVGLLIQAGKRRTLKASPIEMGTVMENYLVWCEDLGHEEADGHKVNAYDGASAARVWAEWHDRKTADYDIANGDETVVTVKEIDSGLVEQYNVSAEAVPSYYSSKVAAAHG